MSRPIKHVQLSSKHGEEKDLPSGDQHQKSANETEIASAPGTSNTPTPAPKSIKIISWNVDGLDLVHFDKRFQTIIDTIKREKADFVFLQVVPKLGVSKLKQSLPQYHIKETSNNGSYLVMLVLINDFITVDDHHIMEFNSSRERKMISVDVHIGCCHIRLCTSQFDDNRNGSEAKISQLRTVLNFITEGTQKGVNAIFGGDTNLLDYEVRRAGSFPGVVDVWEAMGRDKNVQFTYDLSVNFNKLGSSNERSRYDRIFLRKSDGGLHKSKESDIHKKTQVLVPKRFDLLGRQKVVGTRSYPSDHWGVITEFDIRESGSSEKL